MNLQTARVSGLHHLRGQSVVIRMPRTAAELVSRLEAFEGVCFRHERDGKAFRRAGLEQERILGRHESSLVRGRRGGRKAIRAGEILDEALNQFGPVSGRFQLEIDGERGGDGPQDVGRLPV